MNGSSGSGRLSVEAAQAAVLHQQLQAFLALFGANLLLFIPAVRMCFACLPVIHRFANSLHLQVVFAVSFVFFSFASFIAAYFVG